VATRKQAGCAVLDREVVDRDHARAHDRLVGARERDGRIVRVDRLSVLARENVDRRERGEQTLGAQDSLDYRKNVRQDRDLPKQRIQLQQPRRAKLGAAVDRPPPLGLPQGLLLEFADALADRLDAIGLEGIFDDRVAAALDGLDMRLDRGLLDDGFLSSWVRPGRPDLLTSLDVSSQCVFRGPAKNWPFASIELPGRSLGSAPVVYSLP